MFDFYLLKYGSASIIHEQMVSGSTRSQSNPELNLYNSLRNAGNKRSRGNTPSSELERYIGTDFLSLMLPEEFSNFDILAWWKERESHFPVLAAMARDLLSVQASTVASKSTFSLSARVLSIRRTSLTPTSVETCICLKDYLDAAERIQHLTTLGDEVSVEEPIHTYELLKGRVEPHSDEELAIDEFVRSSNQG